MIDYEAFSRIHHLHSRDKLTPAQIAEALDLNLKTVKKWLGKNRYERRKPAVRKSKLDPFKKEIIRMLEKHPYKAVQIFQRIQEDGFDGGYTIVKDYVARVRPPKTRAFLKLSFAPGECAQVDWGSYGSVPVGDTTRRLSFFVMVMCYSRMMYAEFSLSPKPWNTFWEPTAMHLIFSKACRKKSWSTTSNRLF